MLIVYDNNVDGKEDEVESILTQHMRKQASGRGAQSKRKKPNIEKKADKKEMV